MAQTTSPAMSSGGGFIELGKGRTHEREFCDGTCRSLYGKTLKSKSKKGTPSKASALRAREEHASYQADGNEIRIGSPLRKSSIDSEPGKRQRKLPFLGRLAGNLFSR